MSAARCTRLPFLSSLSTRLSCFMSSSHLCVLFRFSVQHLLPPSIKAESQKVQTKSKPVSYPFRFFLMTLIPFSSPRLSSIRFSNLPEPSFFFAQDYPLFFLQCEIFPSQKRVFPSADSLVSPLRRCFLFPFPLPPLFVALSHSPHQRHVRSSDLFPHRLLTILFFTSFIFLGLSTQQFFGIETHL